MASCTCIYYSLSHTASLLTWSTFILLQLDCMSQTQVLTRSHKQHECLDQVEVAESLQLLKEQHCPATVAIRNMGSLLLYVCFFNAG